MKHPRIGLVLGSGSARGWAHIGVIRALEEMGIRPDLVAGCSIGALVGAAYCDGSLDALEHWVRKLSFWDMVRLMDLRLVGGGLLEGDNLMAAFAERISDIAVEDLAVPFASVATDLQSGREIWLQTGSLHTAVRASLALPGLFSPVCQDNLWLVDGGLTNPVPVSLCRAMGADHIIAINLNGNIVGRHLKSRDEGKKKPVDGERDLLSQLLKKLNNGALESRLTAWSRERKKNTTAAIPGLFEVMATAINIMQDRITRGRLAGDPPDLMLSPRLAQLALLDFDRADEAIAEGYECVWRMKAELQHLLDQVRHSDAGR